MTYWGSSLGGLFGAWVLLNEPSTFRRYRLSSPSLWWDGGVIFQHEAAYAQSHDLTARVLVSVGELEQPSAQLAHRHRLPEEARAKERAELATDSVDMVAVAKLFANGPDAPTPALRPSSRSTQTRATSPPGQSACRAPSATCGTYSTKNLVQSQGRRRRQTRESCSGGTHGTSGIVDHVECWPVFAPYWRTGRRAPTDEVVAAALGPLDGGRARGHRV